MGVCGETGGPEPPTCENGRTLISENNTQNKKQRVFFEDWPSGSWRRMAPGKLRKLKVFTQKKRKTRTYVCQRKVVGVVPVKNTKTKTEKLIKMSVDFRKKIIRRVVLR